MPAAGSKLTVSPLRDAHGKIVGASKIARDITDQKEAQQALERQANTLREQAQMLDLANILVRDTEDNIILWNTGMEKLYGWTKVEALGKNVHELLHTALPIPLEQIHELLFQNGQWEGELVHQKKNGDTLIVASQWVLHRDNRGRHQPHQRLLHAYYTFQRQIANTPGKRR